MGDAVGAGVKQPARLDASRLQTQKPLHQKNRADEILLELDKVDACKMPTLRPPDGNGGMGVVRRRSLNVTQGFVHKPQKKQESTFSYSPTNPVQSNQSRTVQSIQYSFFGYKKVPAHLLQLVHFFSKATHKPQKKQESTFS